MSRFVRLLPLLLLILCAGAGREARADSLVLDPIGDTFGAEAVQLDITSVSAAYSATTLTFTVNFSGPVFAPSAGDARSVIGFIDIDSDQNFLTGVPPVTGDLAPPPAPVLGVDFGLNLFTEVFDPGFVEVIDTTQGLTTGLAPISFGASSFSIAVPLALLGGDDGLVNYAVVIGTQLEATDKAPNGLIPATSAPVPEPATMLLLGTGLASIGAAVRRRNKKGK